MDSSQTVAWTRGYAPIQLLWFHVMHLIFPLSMEKCEGSKHCFCKGTDIKYVGL